MIHQGGRHAPLNLLDQASFDAAQLKFRVIFPTVTRQLRAQPRVNADGRGMATVIALLLMTANFALVRLIAELVTSTVIVTKGLGRLGLWRTVGSGWPTGFGGLLRRGLILSQPFANLDLTTF